MASNTNLNSNRNSRDYCEYEDPQIESSNTCDVGYDILLASDLTDDEISKIPNENRIRIKLPNGKIMCFDGGDKDGLYQWLSSQANPRIPPTNCKLKRNQKQAIIDRIAEKLDASNRVEQRNSLLSLNETRAQMGLPSLEEEEEQEDPLLMAYLRIIQECVTGMLAASDIISGAMEPGFARTYRVTVSDPLYRSADTFEDIEVASVVDLVNNYKSVNQVILLWCQNVNSCANGVACGSISLVENSLQTFFDQAYDAFKSAMLPVINRSADAFSGTEMVSELRTVLDIQNQIDTKRLEITNSLKLVDCRFEIQ
jgi:hypothetical protein